ncbi:tetratricopeptide repeat protein [Butyrivibrio sp. LC3010]|uniref:tetratricopeptide repeat protein n=1 Tax=Butyrivibrio sp. LC3010 TaxID=1280680 RepID=UPI0003F98916|nr:tetratricopeptide repeat protein [Butyrivibrio sp. LC3010]
MSSKRVTDIVRRINKLLNEGKHDEAMAVAEKAIVRYPGNFKILKESAQLYSVIYTLDGSEAHKKRSIELYEASLRYISQNDDPDFNEIFIRFMIAELKSEKAPEEAIEDFKKIII